MKKGRHPKILIRKLTPFEEIGKIIADNSFLLALTLIIMLAGVCFATPILALSGYIIALSIIVNLMIKK